MSSEVTHNERVKLSANALDRASTACVAVGLVGPIVATFYGLGSIAAGPTGRLLLFGSLFWISAAATLHFEARRVLGRLR